MSVSNIVNNAASTTGGRPVRTATSLEADAAEKLVEIIAKYEAAGLLGETWTFRVGRSNGGRIRVFHDGECPLDVSK